MFLFGLIDNGVLLLGLIVGFDLAERLPLPTRYRNKAVGGILGGVIGNAISDGLGAIPMGFASVTQVTLGCLSVLVLVPFVARKVTA